MKYTGPDRVDLINLASDIGHHLMQQITEGDIDKHSTGLVDVTVDGVVVGAVLVTMSPAMAATLRKALVNNFNIYSQPEFAKPD